MLNVQENAAVLKNGKKEEANFSLAIKDLNVYYGDNHAVKGISIPIKKMRLPL